MERDRWAIHPSHVEYFYLERGLTSCAQADDEGQLGCRQRLGRTPSGGNGLHSDGEGTGQPPSIVIRSVNNLQRQTAKTGGGKRSRKVKLRRQVLGTTKYLVRHDKIRRKNVLKMRKLRTFKRKK